MTLRIYGASDDLIEVEGDIAEEFSATDTRGGVDYLAFSDGTVLQIKYDNDGVWRIALVARGVATFAKVEAPENDESNYSDEVTLTGDFAWVAHATEVVQREATAVRK